MGLRVRIEGISFTEQVMRAIQPRIAVLCAAVILLAGCAGPLPIPVPPTPTPNPNAAVNISNHQHGEGGPNNQRLITRYGGPVVTTVTTNPANPLLDNPFSIDYLMKDAEGLPITADRLSVTHEKLMHLILVSQDLQTFQHLHPVDEGNGLYDVQTSIPKQSKYILYNEFVTAEGVTQIERNVFASDGADSMDTPASLTQTLNTPVDWNDLVGTLTTTSPRIRRTLPVAFFLNVTTKNGDPVTDMEPWLGAACHVVIVSADTKQFAHTHGDIPGGAMSGDMGSMNMALAMPTPPAIFGPRVEFTHTFMQPGMYRVWVQFTHKGEVATFGFNVNVEK